MAVRSRNSVRVDSPVAALVALLVVSAGCTSRDGAEDSVEGDGDGGLPLPNITAPLVQWVDCLVLGLFLEAPRATAERVVPADFEIKGFTAGDAAMIAELYTCDRVVNDTVVYGAGHFFWSYVFVDPVNESWKSSLNADRYVLDVVVDQEGVVDALKAMGLNVHLGAFETSRTPAGSTAYADAWTITTDAFTVRLQVGQAEGTSSRTHFQGQMWNGVGPYDRVIFDVNGTVLAGAEGQMAVTGDSQLGTALGTMGTVTHPFLTDAKIDTTFVLKYDGKW